MSIRPPSDIVLDVARAADPQVYKEAAARLSQLASLGPASAFAPTSPAEEFGAVFDQVSADGLDGIEPQQIEFSPFIQMPFDAATEMTRLRNNVALAGSGDMMGAASPATNAETGVSAGIATAPAATPSADAYQGFEAMVLASFVESMLPQSSEAVFGAGSAGQIWKSMLAQQIAMQVAESGGIGIADRLQASGVDGLRLARTAGLT